MTELPQLVHLETKQAIVKIIELSIQHGNDPEFVAAVEEAGGFTVFTNFALWRHLEVLTRRAGNGEVFPPGSADEAAFMDVLDNYGHTMARRWLNKRLRTGELVPVTGRRWDGSTQTVMYVPVGSLLESRPHPRPPRRRREVRLTQEGTT